MELVQFDDDDGSTDVDTRSEVVLILVVELVLIDTDSTVRTFCSSEGSDGGDMRLDVVVALGAAVVVS